MKKFNNFKFVIMALVIMPLALIGNSQQLQQKINSVAVESITLASLAGIYGGSKLSEKIADKTNLAKTAKFFKGISHCVALPLKTGLGIGMFILSTLIVESMINKQRTQTKIEKAMSDLTEKL